MQGNTKNVCVLLYSSSSSTPCFFMYVFWTKRKKMVCTACVSESSSLEPSSDYKYHRDSWDLTSRVPAFQLTTQVKQKQPRDKKKYKVNPNVGNFSVLHLQPKHPHTPNTHHEAFLLSPRWTTLIKSASFDKSVLCVAFWANILRTLKKVFGFNCGQKWAERYGEDQDGSDRTYFLENLLVESFCSHQPWDNISSFNLQQRRRNIVLLAIETSQWYQKCLSWKVFASWG